MSDSDNIIKQHTAADHVSCLFDQSLLDSGVPYPADMSGLPTSTPNAANLRRKSRRSWFENTPKGTKFEIAVEKQKALQGAVKRKSEDTEVLTLTHFTAAPRLGFGTLKPGQSKTCTLLLRNPHDYEQTVKLEKVPEKKRFSVEVKKVTVAGGETFPLDITWSPVDVGGVREMLLMQIDSAYRLQAYVYGTVVAPPPKKKTKRTGLLASRATRPFSVIHTSSLANINQEYSPEKKPKVTARAGARTAAVPATHKVVAQPLKNRGRKSGEVRRRSGRLSIGGKTSMASKENCRPAEGVQSADDFVEPAKKAKVVKTQQKLENGTKEMEETMDVVDTKQDRKKLRRSNTYNNVSVGMIVPVIKGAKVHGMLDTSLLGDCDISGIQVLDRTPEAQTDVVTELPSFMDADDQKVLRTRSVNVPQEASFFEVEEKMEKCIEEKLEAVQQADPSFLGDKTSDKVASIVKLNTSFDECDTFHKTDSNMDTKVAHNPQVTKLQTDSFHDSLESSPMPKTDAQDIELPSFLVEDKPSQTKPARKSLRRRSRKSSDAENCQPTEVRLLKSAKRRSRRSVTSSDNIPVMTRRSIGKAGKSKIMSQLKSLKSFIHEKSYEIESGGESSFTSEQDKVQESIDRRETFVRRTSPRFTMPASDTNVRRGTFVADATKLKILETQKPSEASPRRTTFTVVKKQGGSVKSPYRNHSEGLREVTELRSRSKSANLELVEDLAEEEVSEVMEPSTVKSVVSEVYAAEVIRMEQVGVESEASARQRFSADSLEGDDNDGEPSFEKHFSSPRELPANEDEAACRRVTLTVTKLRPSDALMDHMRRTSQTSLFNHSPGKQINENDHQNFSVIVEDGPENSESAQSKELTQNSTFEVPSVADKTGMSESSFPHTPLPNSPQLDHSRRSTHIIEKPKVLNLGISDRKQLFQPGKGLVQYDDSPDSVHVELPEITDVEDPAADDDSPDNVSSRHPEGSNSQDFPEVFSPPSANTRRRTLSARRSLPDRKSINSGKVVTAADAGEVKIDVTADTVEQEPGTVETDQLFFVPFDKTEPTVEKTRQTTVPRDPRNFLKKRSNPVTQAEDKRGAKRMKNTATAEVNKRSNSAPTKGPGKPSQPTRKAPLTRSTRTAGSTSSDVSTSRQVLKPKTNLMKGVAQSKLILMKKSKTALPKHPLPFAAKNMYYDERWMEKQERGFVNWLNFILTPSEEYQGSEVKVKVDAGKLSVEVNKGNVKLAPTNEVLSFRAYSAHRKLNRLRKSACRLFQSEAVIRVVQKLESEVESGRLVVRKDRMLHADLGAKQKILDMFLSYNPLWLRVGIETIYGEVVPLQSNSDVYGLSRYIITRLLSSPDIAMEFAHPTVPHLYRDGYAEATARHTLKKFLMIVYFLDVAKKQRLIEHNPCLFCKDSEMKASKDLLLQFSRNFLSGEGDINRHLGYLGYKVTYAQTALDEFDFAVSNLATDLRDGLRLTRVLELLCEKPDLSRTLRVPAISRLQKIHNVEVVFKTLADQGLPSGEVTTRDIVDGHRERTLKLLWTLIFNHQVELLLNEQQLREEVEILQRSLRLKNKMERLRNYDQSPRTSCGANEPDLHTQSPRLNLLLRWCRCVCAFYNIKIENFTVSFSDGRALCHILHYYHPGLLPLSVIHQDTSLTYLEEMEERNDRQNLDASANDSINSSAVFGDVQDPEVFQQLLANERENFKILFEKVKEVGGVPLMLKWSDMSNTIPDEKVVVTYLLYLCARLLDIRHESRAARVIQLAWRHHRLRKVEAELKVKTQAASVIQRAVRTYLTVCHRHKERTAALCIQRVWRGYQGRCVARDARLEREMAAKMKMILVIQKTARMMFARRRFLRLQTVVVAMQRLYRSKQEVLKCRQEFVETRQAVIKIQSLYRGHKVRENVRKQHMAATLIQSHIRACLARKHLNKMKQAATKIQNYVRSFLAMRQCHRELQTKRSAAIMLQSVYRGQRTRRELKERSEAATVLQSYIRMFSMRQKFLRMRFATTTLQRRWRSSVVAKTCRREFLITKGAAMTIQAFYRGDKVRRNLRHQNASAVVVQSCVRMYLDRRRFVALKKAAITLQVHHRANQHARSCRQQFLICKGAAITIQAFWRGYQCRQGLRQQNVSATVIQSWVRKSQARKRYLAVRGAVISLQNYFRVSLLAREQRRQYLVTKGSAIAIQSAWRGFVVRRSMKKEQSSAIVIQSCVRMFLQRQRFTQMKRAVKMIEARYSAKLEGNRCRREFLQTKMAAVSIQACYRGYVVRRTIRRQHEAAVSIQTCVRMYLARKRFCNVRNAALVLQKYHRANVLSNECREKFLNLKSAAVLVQSCYHGNKVRRELQKLHKSATVIQAWYRMMVTRSSFLKTRRAIITVQQYYQNMMVARSARKQFLVSKGAAITIQSAYRGYVVRQDMKRKNQAAIVIQSSYRMCVARRRFLSLKMVTLRLQTWYRANSAARECRQRYLIYKGAVITIQAHIRGHLVKKDLKNKIDAATKIQSVVRMFLMRKKFVQQREAAQTVQKYFRGYCLMKSMQKQFLVQKGAAITIQAAYRGFRVRKSVKCEHAAATVIQSRMRGYLHRKQFLAVKRAVIQCQRMYRSKLMAHKIKENYESLKSAVVTLQSAFRRRICRQQYMAQRKSAIVLQSHVRKMMARRRYLKMRSAACKIQVWYRGHLLMKECREHFLIQKGAAITLQAHIKGFICRRLFLQYRAARTIQAAYRTYVARRNYLHSRRQIVLCQSAVRAFIARQQVACLRQKDKAARVVQCRWRALVAGRVQRDEFLQLKAAACKVQTLYRARSCMEVCRREFLIQKGATITLQAAVKGWLVRKRQLEKNRAAVCIQSAIRGFIERRRYTRVVSAICLCQRVWRARLYGQIQHYRYLEMKEAAVTVQSLVRMKQCRVQYQRVRKAAISIQSWYRGARQRRVFCRSRQAAITLQDRWRAEVLCRQHVIQYMALKEMAVFIQSRFRARRAREEYQRLRATVRLQSFCRMWAERRRYLMLRQAVVTIQCQVRVLLARRCLQKLREEKMQERQAHLDRVVCVARVNLAATRIQRCFRNHLMMKAAQEKLHSIVVIQRWFRTYRQRLQFMKDRRRIIRVQACVRMWLARRDKAARVIQRATRVWLATFEDRKKRRSATTIQALWRGYMTRKNSKSKRLAETRRRVIEATASATEDKKLGNRTASALDYLLRYKHLSQVLDALMHLEVATRLASVCCERMVEVNAVPVLYRLIRSCNRSLPHMEIIKYTIFIMLNLAKYDKTRHSLYEDPEGVTTLIEQLQIYREKKGPIFIKTCTLLGILALDTEFKKGMLSDKKVIEKLRSIHTLTARKHKLEENQRVTRAKMNATLNSSCMVRQPTKRHSIRPDWSLHKDRMAEIQNPMRAIDFVLVNLGLPVK